MLADTDVGSVITAGQSGVQWGYRLLLLQLVLVPILFMVQELTVRLGIFTGRGHGELIRETFGRFWAWVSAGGLGVATVGALLTEFSGVAGVGEMYGVPRWASLPVAAVALLAVVLTGSYRRVELVAIAVGLFEFAFFFVAWAAHPDPHALVSGALSIPFANKEYLYLAAANIGAVIMPWMIFYQQSAVADKKLRPEYFTAARWDTAIGAVITQLVMAAVLVACAATIGRASPTATLSTVGDMSQALTPFLGATVGSAVYGAGVLGAGMVAAIVASLAFAWGLGPGRSGGIPALARVPAAASALVLWRLRRLGYRRLRRCRAVARSRVPERGRAGDERAAAAAGAGIPDRPRPPRPARRPTAAGRVFLGGAGCCRCHLRPRRLRRVLGGRPAQLDRRGEFA
jgi:Mn2+/Fe2+ NRAMP family transporter